MADLFDSIASPPGNTSAESYSAKDIEVLEGLEPVRRRPGMYVGGTDERALHHLAAEVLDNAMDEAVAGHATRIELELDAEGLGHRARQRPRHPGRPASAVSRQIGARDHPDDAAFGRQVRRRCLRDLGRAARRRRLGGQRAVGRAGGRGGARPPAVVAELPPRRARGPLVRTPARCRTGAARCCASIPTPRSSARPRSARRCSTAWRAPRPTCSAASRSAGAATRRLPRPDGVPEEARLHFPGGLGDFLAASLAGRELLTAEPFIGRGRVPERAAASNGRSCGPTTRTTRFCHSYCNTIPTPEGGTHEAGLRNALVRGIKAYGELIGNRRIAQATGDDVAAGTAILLSVFLREPQFQGQTKERLASAEATRLVEAAVRDHFDHWLSADPATGRLLLDRIAERAEERQRRRQQKEMARKSADPQAAPARQARRLQPRQRRRHRDLPGRGRQRRRLGEAGARPRDPGDPAAARQDPQRRQRHRRQDARQPGIVRPRAGLGLRRRQPLPRRGRCATSGSSS